MESARAEASGGALEVLVELEEDRANGTHHVRERLQHVREHENPERPGERDRISKEEVREGREGAERAIERQQGQAHDDAWDRNRDVAQGVERACGKDAFPDGRIRYQRAEEQLEGDHDDRDLKRPDEWPVQTGLAEQLTVPRPREWP